MAAKSSWDEGPFRSYLATQIRVALALFEYFINLMVSKFGIPLTSIFQYIWLQILESQKMHGIVVSLFDCCHKMNRVFIVLSNKNKRR